MEDDELTPEELAAYEEMGMGLGYPKLKEKEGLFNFFNKILVKDDTIKVANIDEDELFAVRNLRDGNVVSKMNGYEIFEDYFKNKGEVILASSDSKDGFLIKAAITTKKELESKTKRKVNKGWFKKKEKEVEV